ncbi:kinase/transcriptional regulator, LuxR family domain protein [Mycobacterium kansasii]|uniref:Kinase/transcriptional regulator, LuxR family domain protein n=1 Tax=Mycobacterium kansasii TaxID=1768 RepID=A0A1V3WMY7_MYCKA|nr:kinase/transcriptional regulator, LuxR family domain protein [Mycobacterium kansasii]
MATSREPIKVAGELTWRVPSLSVADATAFFTDRALLARPDFVIDDDSAAMVRQICRRLDGMPLALELAAARVRSLSLSDILAGLDDSIRLLTGGARTALRRHQTLRASLDWSYGLLSEPERILLRRLGCSSADSTSTRRWRWPASVSCRVTRCSMSWRCWLTSR